jgi:hypothetical protein
MSTAFLQSSAVDQFFLQSPETKPKLSKIEAETNRWALPAGLFERRVCVGSGYLLGLRERKRLVQRRCR